MGFDKIPALVDELAKHIGLSAVLVFVICAVLVFVWYQHQRNKLLEERLEFERMSRKESLQPVPTPATPPPVQPQLQSATGHRQAVTPVADTGAKSTAQRRRKKSTSSAKAPAKRAIRVVVADDNEALLEGVRMSIEMVAGTEVQTALDGVLALERVRAFMPDILYLDLNMPRLQGELVLAELSNINPLMHVVIITGMPPDRVAAAKECARDMPNVSVLQKPFSMEDIAMTLQAAQDTR